MIGIGKALVYFTWMSAAKRKERMGQKMSSFVFSFFWCFLLFCFLLFCFLLFCFFFSFSYLELFSQKLLKISPRAL